MFHRPLSFRISPVRLPVNLLLGLALAACTTEVRSLTHVEASLEAGHGLGPIQISHLARGDEAAARDVLEVHYNGQPLVGGSGQTVTVHNREFGIDYFVPEGSATIGFVRDGQTVAVSDAVEFAADRINYFVLHGEPSSPELLVVSDPYQQRRVRVINVHEDGDAFEFALANTDEMPLMDRVTLEYGDWWAETAPDDARFVQYGDASGTTGHVPINCDPTFRLVVEREDASDFGPSLGPLLAPSAPESAEAAAATCYEPDCDCESGIE